MAPSILPVDPQLEVEVVTHFGPPPLDHCHPNDNSSSTTYSIFLSFDYDHQLCLRFRGMAPSTLLVDSQLEVEETHSAPPPSLHFAKVWMPDVEKVHN